MKDVFYDWGGLNGWLFRLINGLSGNSFYDSLMLFFTRLGAKENFHYYFGLILVYTIGEIWLVKARHKHVTQQHIKGALAMLITMVMGFMVAGLLIGISKTIIALPRPFVLPDINAAMAQGKLHFLDAPPPPTDYYSSFPSGHAATIAFIVTALWHKFPQKPLRYAGLALIFLVCWSRIAVGMHFPADVVAGVAIGWFSASYVRLYVYRTLRVPLPGQTLAVKVATIPAATQPSHTPPSTTTPAPPHQQPPQPMRRNV